MAGILNEFVQNTKILSSKVNENFAIVQDDITELGQALNSNFSTQLVSIKNDLLTDIETVSGQKASKDLSDVEPVSEFKESILEYISPDFSAAYDFGAGFITPSAGWVYFRGWQDRYSAVTIGGQVFEVSYDTGDGQSRGALSFFVGKGVSITSFESITMARFYPCKGA
jgi:hypothetical protein